MTKTTIVASLATLIVAGALAGCGGATDAGGRAVSGAGPAAAPVGVFAPVADAPEAFRGLGGTAELKDGSGGGSDVSIALSGLKPGVTYLSHLHVGVCDQPDAGGPHFKFDLDGPDRPPNEIHLSFTSNATGHASAQAHSARRVPAGAAGSIVVHQDGPAAGASTGSAAGKRTSAAGHAQHGGSAAGGSGAGAGGHSHAAKVGCAALRAPTPTGAPAGRSAGRPAPAIRVEAGQPVGGVRTLTVRKGDRVAFTVTADEPEIVHVHGYDVSRPVGPATPARLGFPADIDGIFEVELEGSGVQILRLRVNP